jgi:hypothetical protein
MSYDDRDPVDEQLRRLRPRLPDERLQRAAARAGARAAGSNPRSAPNGKDSFMRSRVTILLMLVFGFAFSGAGTGLAVQSLDQNTTPAEAQYGPKPTTDKTPDTPTTPGTPTSPDGPSGGGVNPTTDEEPGEVLDEGGVAGEQAGGENAPTTPASEDVQVARQTGVQESGDSLPMTGFAAIPVLLIGIALLVGGFVLRGSARKGEGA